MKKVIIFVTCIIIIVFCLFIILKNEKNINQNENLDEYTPEEEISIAQNRMTMVTLYFIDKEKKELVPEVRNVDVKELMKSPYEKIMTYLVEGSTDPKIGKIIPEGTKINSIKYEKGELFIDFDEKLLSDLKDNNKNIEFELLMKSITSTYMELKEISNVDISIEGKPIYNEKNQ